MSEAGVASEKVRNIFSNFEKKFQEGTKDPDKFLTISELESRWASLRKDILECGDEMVRRLVESVDEKDLVKKKKRNFKTKESIS